PATATPGATIPNVGTSPASTEKACAQPTGWIKYTVKLGDNLTRISVKYRISVSNLKSVNCLAGNIIRTGWQLWVPNVPTSTFTSSPTATQQPPDTPKPPPMQTAPATLTSTWTAPVPTAPTTPIAPSDSPTPSPTPTINPTYPLTNTSS
ncbi:MAG: LysM peptidoglycan-binding domain-containing protein, partial [Bellilinea sp.]